VPPPRLSCTEIDSHVIARLSRTRADGEHSLLSLGSIGPACWRIDAERSTSTAIAINIDTPEPLVPREPVTLRFSLTHTGRSTPNSLTSRRHPSQIRVSLSLKVCE
jgi:hypothetical protein